MSRLIAVILMAAATSIFANYPSPVFAGGNPGTDTLTCYAEKPVLFGKYPVSNTEMSCVMGISKNNSSTEKHIFSIIFGNYDLVASFQEKDRIIFIFAPK